MVTAVTTFEDVDEFDVDAETDASTTGVFCSGFAFVTAVTTLEDVLVSGADDEDDCCDVTTKLPAEMVMLCLFTKAAYYICSRTNRPHCSM